MRRGPLGYALLAGTVLSWQGIGMVASGVTKEYPHYYFVTWMAHNSFMLAGVIYMGLIACGYQYVDSSVKHDFSSKRLQGIAVVMSSLSMAIAMTWFYSLPYTILSANNAIYQSAPLFVFIFSVCFLGETVRTYKIVALIVSFSGVLLLSFFTKAQHLHNGDTQKSTLGGYLLVLVSAVTFAVYEVFYEAAFHNHDASEAKTATEDEMLELREFNLEEEADSPRRPEEIEPFDQLLNSLRLVALLGMYNCVLLFPGAWLAGKVGIEDEFVAPSGDMLGRIIVVGMLELSYNIFLFAGIAKNGSVFMAVGQILIIPTGYFFEILENAGIPPHHTVFNYLGTVMVLLGFLILQNFKCTRRLYSSKDDTEELRYDSSLQQI